MTAPPPDGQHPHGPAPDAIVEDEGPVDPRDIASAGRSCSAIIVLMAVLLLVICVGISVRWVAAP